MSEGSKKEKGDVVSGEATSLENFEEVSAEIEQYRNEQMGKVEEAKQKMVTMFGLSEEKLNEIISDGILIAKSGGVDKAKDLLETYKEKGTGWGLNPDSAKELGYAINRTHNYEYGQAAINLAAGIERIRLNVANGKGALNMRGAQKREKDVAALTEEFNEIGM